MMHLHKDAGGVETLLQAAEGERAVRPHGEEVGEVNHVSGIVEVLATKTYRHTNDTEDIEYKYLYMYM